jgi:hypothetical protein
LGDGADADNGPLVAAGVPGASLSNIGWTLDNNKVEPFSYYFLFHHTNADTFTVIDPMGVKNSVAGNF